MYERRKKIKEIYIEIEKLAMIDKKQLKFGIKPLANNPLCKEMKIKIKFLPAKIKCGNNNIEILRGKEILLTKVVLE